MKYIYILENEARFRDEMIEAILKIDPQMGIRLFDTLEEFSEWIKLVIHEGPEALPKGGRRPEQMPEVADPGPSQLVLVISKNEFFGAKHMNLLRKTQDLFVRKGLCTAEDPTSLVLTSFESPDFDIKLVEDRIINNVLFKPFDKLILLQDLTFAIGGRHPASSYSVHNMKTTAIIEMLKGVQIEALSDVGFISISNRPIKVGSVSKYYSDAFMSLKQRSMMAICVGCEPHPHAKDFFRCSFSYLAADAFQISNLRKTVRRKNAKAYPFAWYPEAAKVPETAPKAAEVVLPGNEIAIISKDETLIHSFRNILENRFHNARVHVYYSLEQFIYAVDPEKAAKNKKKTEGAEPITPAPPCLHAIFADETFFTENFRERWQNLSESVEKNLKAPKSNRTQKSDIFMLSNRIFSDLDERAFGEVVKDIFFVPLDPIYLGKKLKLFLPTLAFTEEIEIVTCAEIVPAKVATPIEISEFSEAGLVMKYYRAISVGAFREFILWYPAPHEMDLPELLATCNYTEPNPADATQHQNHFVFFGMNDHFLTHIRRWMVVNYVNSKESQSA